MDGIKISIFAILLLFSYVYSENGMEGMDMSSTSGMKENPANDPKDICHKYSNCVNCTLAEEGCNWCSSGMSTSFCTSLKTAAEAHCDMSECSTDLFADKVSLCFGGCESAQSCDTCQLYMGCGWCYSSGKCLETDMKGTKPKECPESWAWQTETCEAPCESNFDCTGCSFSDKCSWCPSSNKCVNNVDADSTCITECPNSKPINPPVSKPSNSLNNKKQPKQTGYSWFSMISGVTVMFGVMGMVVVASKRFINSRNL